MGQTKINKRNGRKGLWVSSYYSISGGLKTSPSQFYMRQKDMDVSIESEISIQQIIELAHDSVGFDVNS